MDSDLNILIVDDSVTYRRILSAIVQDISGVNLMGTAPNGRIALSKIARNSPDLVLLDVFMAEMDGLETLQRIKAEYPHIDVIMVSGMDREVARITVQALEAGALDFIPKPGQSPGDPGEQELRRALGRLIPVAKAHKYSRQIQSLSRGGTRPVPPIPASPPPEVSATVKPPVLPPDVRPRTVPPPESPPVLRPLPPVKKTNRIDVVAIGVSTGGPNALQEIIPRLPKDFPVPILAVQHMPPLFTASLAARLDSVSDILVVEGGDGHPVRKGHMYIAPGGRHMVVRKVPSGDVVIGLIDSPPVNSCRPAVDILFRSIAMIYGGNVLTVILTGMGNDGLAGVSAIHRKGGYSLVQDQPSSVVWGMPGAVVEADRADAIVPLSQMADRIVSVLKRVR